MLHSFKQIFIENPGTVLCPRGVKADGHCPRRACKQKRKKCGECKEARIEIHIWEPAREALESHLGSGWE